MVFKCGPQVSPITVTQDLVKMQVLKPHPRLPEMETWGCGAQEHVFPQAFQGILMYARINYFHMNSLI